MKSRFLVLFLAIDVCADFTNLTTLIYIATSFNIKTHVFTLIFLDSLISTLCSVISTLFDSLLLAGQIQANANVCFLAFLTAYLSNCFGAILTFLIAAVRYILAKLSAKNIQPLSMKVSAIALAVFTALGAISVAICVTHAVLDLPMAFSIEVCADRDLFERPIKPLSTLLLSIPNIYKLFSMVVDIKMILFLRKVIIPAGANVLLGLGTHFLHTLYFVLFCKTHLLPVSRRASF